MRSFQRAFDHVRPVSFERNVCVHAEGSCLVSFGRTRVLCTATVEERVPPWLKGKSQGWVTAEYGMLPRSTGERMRREAVMGKQSGRTQEIQRLIGRSLRAVVDLNALGERQVMIDCDVLQADGGTRTAAITGAFIALVDSLQPLSQRKAFEHFPIQTCVAAVSCGVVGGQCMLDLDYEGDSTAEVDANFVITSSGELIEVQASAEKKRFDQSTFLQMMTLANTGIAQLIDLQKQALSPVLID